MSESHELQSPTAASIAIPPLPFVPCMSMWQPWALFMVCGIKRFETRPRPMSYDGPLVIHAALKWNNGLAYMCSQPPFADALRECGIKDPSRAVKELDFGAALGMVMKRYCISTTESEQQEIRRTAPHLAVPPAGDREYHLGNFASEPERFYYPATHPWRAPVPAKLSGSQSLPFRWRGEDAERFMSDYMDYLWKSHGGDRVLSLVQKPRYEIGDPEAEADRQQAALQL